MVQKSWMWLKYIILLPLSGLFPHPFPYLCSRCLARMEGVIDSARRASVRKGMAPFLEGGRLFGKSVDRSVREYFEVILSDEIDSFIYRLGFSKRFLRSLRIDGIENLEETLKDRGAILLSAHFGGGLWILPFLRSRGVSVHFFSADITKERYPSDKALYFYHRFRSRVVQIASGEKVLYKGEGREGLIQSLREGQWVAVLFDAPPFLVKEKMEVSFLNRKARFPKGIISIAKDLNVPILPFFSYLEGGSRRIVFERPFHVIDEEEGVRVSVALIEKNVMERPGHWHFWPIAEQFFSTEGNGGTA